MCAAQIVLLVLKIETQSQINGGRLENQGSLWYEIDIIKIHFINFSVNKNLKEKVAQK